MFSTPPTHNNLEEEDVVKCKLCKCLTLFSAVFIVAAAVFFWFLNFSPYEYQLEEFCSSCVDWINRYPRTVYEVLCKKYEDNYERYLYTREDEGQIATGIV